VINDPLGRVKQRTGYGLGMTRDEAIRVGIFTLSDWHRRDHGERCVCLEGEQLGAQSAAVVDALAAEGMRFEGYSGADRGPLGLPPRNDR
jgi:hypothetical protein